MPLSLRRGRVTSITERVPGLVRLDVDGAACVAYPGATGEVDVGDDVLVNTQARELALGTGGFDVLYANLTRGLGLPAEAGAHVMVLPYTPGQRAVRQLEEDGPLADDLAALPVVCCTVHSQVAPACAALDGLRVAYAQVAGGALPVALSDTIRSLCARGLVETTVAVAPCSDADRQAVTPASALAWAAAAGFDAVVSSPGPGIVGTGSRLGHGALALVDVANLAGALGGSPVLAARVSEQDARARHRGVSHHTRTVLELSQADVRLAWPRGLEPAPRLERCEEVDAAGWRDACGGLELSFMGRGPDEEPWFFAAAYAAGLVARRDGLWRRSHEDVTTA
jgi:hypothetical protein